MQTFYKICLILLIVGGINWGLVGLFQFDFVGWLLGGSASIWSRIVFMQKQKHLQNQLQVLLLV